MSKKEIVIYKPLGSGSLKSPKKMKTDKVKTSKQARPAPLPQRSLASKTALSYTPPECSLHYLGALVNPFDTTAGVCVPADLFPLPSSKVKAFARTTMTLGTSGIGWVAGSPLGSNNGSFMTVTTAASVGTAATALTAFTNVTNLSCAQLPYDQPTLNAGVSYRIVSYGLRVKYIGKLLNRNGICVSFEDPDHADVRFKSYNEISGNPYSSLTRVGDGMWDAAVCYSGPVSPIELEFVQTAYYCPGDAPIGIIVSGVAGDQYEVEGYCHIEYIGSKVVNKTMSHADGATFGKVLEVVKGQTANAPIEPALLPSLWERFKNAVSSSLPSIVEMGVGAAMTAARNPRGLAMIAHGGGDIMSKLLNGGVPTHQGRNQPLLIKG